MQGTPYYLQIIICNRCVVLCFVFSKNVTGLEADSVNLRGFFLFGKKKAPQIANPAWEEHEFE